jgi:hypothetical protein
VPVAPPSVLPGLVSAFDKMRAGKAAAKPAADGKVIYEVDGYRFLMKK